jgi:hypothetical protein
MSMSVKRNSGMLIAGAVLIALGVLSLVGQLFSNFPFWSYFWPFIIIFFGGLFFVGMFVGGKSMAGLAIPGSIITLIGLMMFVQNLFNHWESWAYGWTVILFAVGLGIFIMGLYSGEERQRLAGMRVMRIGVILFIIFGAFFELIFSSFSRHGVAQYLFPALLVLLGVYLVVTRSGWLSTRHQDSIEPPAVPTQENK